MSGAGAPGLELSGSDQLSVAIVAASWHDEVMDGLIAGATRTLDDLGIIRRRLVRVPGAFELSLVALELARGPSAHDHGERKGAGGEGTGAAGGAGAGAAGHVGKVAGSGYDAVVALGVVIRGGTPHFEYVCRAATEGLTRVALDTGVPVGFGVLTCDDEAQALARAGGPGSSEDKGREAVEAAVATALALRSLRRP